MNRRTFLLGSTSLTLVPLLASFPAACANPIRPGLLTARAYSQTIIFSFMGGSLGAATYTNAATETYWDDAGVLQTASLNAGRFDHDPADSNIALGLIIEGSVDNDCPNPRDLTNAAWVKTSCTAALDATGVDGSANAASTLTATGANATCLDAITLASAERTFSARVKRKTGTGQVDITIDNGATWTEITAEIASGEWERPLVTQTLANPTIGFRIVTSGDEIEVDMAQLEDGPHPTSEITTGGATRAANTLTLPVVAGAWNWVFAEPAAMTTADSRWVRQVIITNVNTSAETCDVEVFYTDPTDNSEASILLTGESLTAVTTYILDGLGATPVGAWDVGHILTEDAVSGPHFELREDNGNTLDDFTIESDGIARNGSSQTVAAWLTAQSATNAYIRTIYAQVGSVDIVQTTNANQPLYSATAFNTGPCGVYDGTNHYMTANGLAATFSGTDTPVTLLCAIEADVAAPAALKIWWGLGRSVDNDPIRRIGLDTDQEYTIQKRDDVGGGGTLIEVKTSGTDGDTDPHILTLRDTGTAVSFWEDSSELLTDESLDDDTITVDLMGFGAYVRAAVSDHWDGNIAGAIIFSTAIDTSILATLRADYVSLKGV